jgi:hypothetical protein
MTAPRTGYAPVDGHEIYYEIHGSELTILPGTPHSTIVTRADLIGPLVQAFLDRPLPSAD